MQWDGQRPPWRRGDAPQLRSRKREKQNAASPGTEPSQPAAGLKTCLGKGIGSLQSSEKFCVGDHQGAHQRRVPHAQDGKCISPEHGWRVECGTATAETTITKSKLCDARGGRRQGGRPFSKQQGRDHKSIVCKCETSRHARCEGAQCNLGVGGQPWKHAEAMYETSVSPSRGKAVKKGNETTEKHNTSQGRVQGRVTEPDTRI